MKLPSDVAVPYASRDGSTGRPVDCVYVAASAHDARYTRTCVASIRKYHPDVPVRLLRGGTLQPGLADELHRYWDVDVAPIPSGDYGWGFVKLEPLFGPPGERFLVLDSDTVITGPVLEVALECDAPFIVDDELQSEDDTRRLYYDWRDIRRIDGKASPPLFVANTGQWFGTSGLLTRGDFEPWVEWSMPRALRHTGIFMCGEQGLLNYVLNQKAMLSGLRVERRRIMRWPGHSLAGLDRTSVAGGRADAVIVHWAGVKGDRGSINGGDLLEYFDQLYYAGLPWGGARRAANALLEAITRLRVGLAARAGRLR